MRIVCPDNNRQEREYIISFFFRDLLKAEAEIVFETSATDYTIWLDESRRIVVEDHFFNLHKEPLSYLDLKNIPSGLAWFHYEDREIPVIYGQDRLEFGDGEIRVGLDIFASSFFMLSRWEEYALGRDKISFDLERSVYQMDEDKLFCVKNNLTDRAVVHEYEFLLRSLMLKLGTDTQPERQFSVLLTHDVDELGTAYFSDIFSRVFGKLKKRQIKAAYKILSRDLGLKFYASNRFKLFEKYLEQSRKYGYTDVFLMKCCERGEEECTYQLSDRCSGKVIKSLKKESAAIGIHPSPSTLNNDGQFIRECNRFQDAVGNKPLMGRNHRLVYNTNTLHQWESASIHLVSNCAYQKRMGFRCGIAVPFPVFDINARKVTSISELPVLIMDTSSRKQFADKAKRFSHMFHLLDIVAAYKGIVCLNWHERLFSRQEYIHLLKLYSCLLGQINEKGAVDFLKTNN